MKKIILSLLLTQIFLFSYPKSTHALIILPALILIPIAKIVAIIIGGFSLPAIGSSLLWSRLTGSPLKKTISLTILILITMAAILALALYLQNPNRPLV